MPTASQNIPLIAQPWISDRAKKTLDIVEKFVNEECIPADTVYAAQLGEGAQRWGGHPSVIENLKKKAQALQIWNMFLPKNHFKEGAGFSNLEYGLIAEQLGKSGTASEVCFSLVSVHPTWTLTCSIGHQLRGSRHRKHGSHCSLRYTGTERPLVEASPRGQDPICLPHD